MSIFDLSGLAAVITGGNGGIGLGIAQALATAGCNVSIWGRNAEKNKAAWDAALKAAGNRDYTSRILAKANHSQFEAKIGSNAEAPSLQRFVPAYFTTIHDWLAKRIGGFR